MHGPWGRRGDRGQQMVWKLSEHDWLVKSTQGMKEGRSLALATWPWKDQ